MQDLDLFDGTLTEVQTIEGIPHALALTNSGTLAWFPIRHVTVYSEGNTK